MRSERDRADVEEFVAVCSGRLLGTADLLIGDPDRAEQLLVRALAEAWSSWRRLDAPPETYVRQVLVARATTRWRPVGPGRPAAGDDRLRRALAGLTRRQRAVVVLLWYDGLDEEDTAAALGCSAATVATVASAALVRLGVSPGPQVDVLRRDLAALVDRSPGPRTRRLIEAMDDRAVVDRSRRRIVGTAIAGCALVALVAVVAVLPRLAPDPVPVRPPPDDSLVVVPPQLVDHQLQAVVRVGGVDYGYLTSEESTPGSGLLRVSVEPSPTTQLLVWVSPPDLRGAVVLSIDGEVIRRDPAGLVESGPVLVAGRTHVVVVRATHLDVSARLGVAVYQRQ